MNLYVQIQLLWDIFHIKKVGTVLSPLGRIRRIDIH